MALSEQGKPMRMCGTNAELAVDAERGSADAVTQGAGVSADARLESDAVSADGELEQPRGSNAPAGSDAERTFEDAVAGTLVTCSASDLRPSRLLLADAPSACTQLFFPGCSFLNASMPLVEAVFTLLREQGRVDGISLLCCGKILQYNDDAGGARAAFEADLLEAFAHSAIERIVAPCPNCVEALRALLASDVRTAHIEVVPLALELAQLGYRVDASIAARMLADDERTRGREPLFAVHDSCPDRATGEFARSVRVLLGEDLFKDPAHSGRRSFCCGSIPSAKGRFDQAEKLARRHGDEALAAGAPAIVTACMSCALMLSLGQRSVPAFHYLELLFDCRIDWDSVGWKPKVRFLLEDAAATCGESVACGEGVASEEQPPSEDGKRSNDASTAETTAARPRPFVGIGRAAARARSRACGREVRPTNCHFCGYCCAFNAVVENGRVVELAPDPTRYPYDERILAGCRRWRMNADVLDSPRRVNYPLKRAGERGDGAWERVTWDDALDDIARRLEALKTAHGPGTLASAIGGPHASFWPLHRFMSLFGSPNNMGIGQICWNPRIWMDAVTFGWTIEADIVEGLTECLFIWGTNPAQSDNSAFWRTIRSFSRTAGTLVVIDPRRTQVAALADIWLPVRPGTDCTLALGLIHVIVEEGLVDAEFVDEWCSGFDELAAHVAPHTPERVGAFCGVDPADIVAAARAFGEARAAALVSGRGVDQTGASVAPTHRAICCLRAVTGNVDRPGSCLMTEQSDFVPEVEFEMSDALTPGERALCLNTPYTPLQCFDGYDKVRALTEKLGRRLPMRYMTSASPDRVLAAMETGVPYPVRALIVNATNPLLTYADTNRVFKAFMNLDLIVVLEYYLTPTAAIADYVLPVAGAVERPIFQIHGGVANIGYGGPAAVDPYYERKTDYDVFRELGSRLGQADSWPDETLADAFARQLAPTGMSWEDYCAMGIYSQRPAYEKHRVRDARGRSAGFATTTGKIELASEILPQVGGTRLPEQAKCVRLCSPDLIVRAQEAGGAHLEMITGSRKQPYNASMYLDNPVFRRSSPYPLAEVSARTAERLGFAAGDAVQLETDFGRAVFRLGIAEMRDDLINVDYGWWHPEWEPGAPDFGGIWKSNVNCLTSCAMREPMIGTWAYNAIDCVITKAREPLSFEKPPARQRTDADKTKERA